MYEINYGNLKTKRILSCIVFGLGIILFIALLIVNISGENKKSSLDSKIEASMINENCSYTVGNGYSCSPIYFYEINGRQYQCLASGYSAKRISEENKYVYYNMANPSLCQIDWETSADFVLVIFNALMVIPIALGVLGFFLMNKKIKKIERLGKYGMLIKNLEYIIKNNDRGKKVLVVDYIAPTGDTIRLVRDKKLEKGIIPRGYIDLLIDPNDFKNYFLDFSIKTKNGFISVPQNVQFLPQDGTALPTTQSSSGKNLTPIQKQLHPPKS